MPLEEDVHRLFISQEWTLCLAESCTGGHVAARLTRLAGASQYFLGSLVVYSNALKTQILGVPEALIAQHGAVSEAVAKAMVQGALSLSGSDFAIAVTGIAGPSGGSLEKPVGTIWATIAHKEGTLYAWKFHLQGNREAIIAQSADIVLKEIIQFASSFK